MTFPVRPEPATCSISCKVGRPYIPTLCSEKRSQTIGWAKILLEFFQHNICPQHLISVPHTSQMGYQVHVSQISSLTKQSPFLWLPGSSSLFSSGFKISHLIFTSTSILYSLPVLLLTFHPRHVGQSDCPGVSIHLGHPLPDIKLGATGNTFPVIQPRSVERKIKDMCLFVSRKRLFRLLLKL